MMKIFLALPCLISLMSITTTSCMDLLSAENIHEYVRDESKAKLLQFLSNHGNINSVDSSGNSLLHTAAKYCTNSEIISFLIENGANINAANLEGKTPLELAFDNNSSASDIIKILLNKGANMDLLDNAGHSVYDNVRYNHKANVELLDQFRQEHQIMNNNLNSNNQSMDSLEELVQDGNIQALEAKLQQNWNVNSMSKKNRLGDTLLHLAVRKKNENMVRTLLKYGANVNAPNMLGETPLHIVVKSGSNAVAKALLENGANLDLVDNSGYSSYVYAFENKNDNVSTYNLLTNFKTTNNYRQVSNMSNLRQQNIKPTYQQRYIQQGNFQSGYQQRYTPQRNFTQGYIQPQNLQPYPQQNFPMTTNQNPFQNNDYYNGNMQYQNNYYQNITPKQQENMKKRQIISNIGSTLVSLFTN